MVPVSVIGLGKLGQCIAAAMAARGLPTVGIDTNVETVDALACGRPTVVEPGLPELLEAGRARLQFCSQYEAAIRHSDVTFIIVPTPSEPDGGFSSSYVEEVLVGLGRSLRRSTKPYHLFVLISTVMPGTGDSRLIPLLERISGRQVNEGFGYCYCPAFVALGNVVRNFLRPDVVVVGASDERAGAQAAGIYRQVCENEPPIHRMSVVDVEIMKLSLNCFVTLKVSFANTLANLCSRIPGADVDRITAALGADRRIGPHALRAGLSYGGPCFPRDTRAFVALAQQVGLEGELFQATEQVNQAQHAHLEQLVLDHLPPGPARVGVLGLAYKPDTPVLDESPGLALVRRLLERGIEVVVHDPLALEGVWRQFGHQVEYATTPQECLARSAVAVVTMPAREYKEIDAAHFGPEPTVVIDCWRILDPARLGPSVTFVPLGRGPVAAAEEPAVALVG